MLHVRQARLDDLAILTTLFDGYRVWYGQSSDPIGARHFLQERMLLGESVVFMAFVDGEAVGFTQLYPAFSSIRLRRAWILNDLFVAQTARGRGVGVALLDAARGLARQSGAWGLVLETAPDNLHAQRLYERYGFVEDGGRHYQLEV